MFFGCEQQGCYNEPEQGSFRHWDNGCFMTEQKKKLSKLCLTGFILSVLPLGFAGVIVWYLFMMKSDDYSTYYYVMSLFITAFPIIMFLLTVAGLGLSIAGLATAPRKGKRGRGFGIAGIVFPVLYVIVVFILFGLLGFAIVRGIKTDQRDKETSDIYHMGSVYDPQNTEFDVSQYRITKGYDINSQDNPSSESELKKFAKSRLDTISKENDVFVKGKYRNYDFLIIRRDRFDDWGKIEPIGSVDRWSKEYLTIQYQYQWEFSAFRTCYLDMYKDPSDKYIIITNCSDYRVITLFFS